MLPRTKVAVYATNIVWPADVTSLLPEIVVKELSPRVSFGDKKYSVLIDIVLGAF